PNINKETQTKQNYSNKKIVNSKGVKNVDEINDRMINSRPVVATRTIALALILIGSVIAGGASWLRYVPMVNNQEPGNPLLYHPMAFSPTTSKFQPLNTSTPTQEARLNTFVVTATIDPGGGSFIDNVFVVED